MGLHIELIELYRIEEPIEKVIEYWKPSGCILEGSGNLIVGSDSCASVPVVHIDPNDKTLADPAAHVVTNDSEQIADLAVAELAKTECSHFAFIGWTHRVGWSRRRERRFCERLKDAGKTPMIYFNTKQSFKSMYLEELTEYPFWLASYSGKMEYPYTVDYWQYTNQGSVPGIPGNADIKSTLIL